MKFRPLLVLTLFTLPALALLVWLGSWQLERAAWKRTETDSYLAAGLRPPADLETLLCGDEVVAGQRVALEQEPSGEAVRLYGVDAENRPGWRLLRPVDAPDCAEGYDTVLVETGFEPLNGDVRAVTGEFRLSRAPGTGMFTPANNPQANEFYTLAPEAMAARLAPSGTPSGDVLVARGAQSLPPHLSQTPPSRHYGYAITWFGLAAALIGVYLALHIARGRLIFTRSKD
jgi:surfeit locus 1 family protein